MIIIKDASVVVTSVSCMWQAEITCLAPDYYMSTTYRSGLY